MAKTQGLNLVRHLPAIVEFAKSRGMKRVDLLDRSGIKKPRHSEWVKGARPLSPYYFCKLMKGLGLTMETLQDVGIVLEQSEKEVIRACQFAEENVDILRDFIRNPDLWKAAKSLRDNWPMKL